MALVCDEPGRAAWCPLGGGGVRSRSLRTPQVAPFAAPLVRSLSATVSEVSEVLQGAPNRAEIHMSQPLRRGTSGA